LPNKNGSVPPPIQSFVVSKKCFVQKDSTWEQIDEDIIAKGGCLKWILIQLTAPARPLLPHLGPSTIANWNILVLANWQAYQPRKIARV
jgi:hypothetical protein